MWHHRGNDIVTFAEIYAAAQLIFLFGRIKQNGKSDSTDPMRPNNSNIILIYIFNLHQIKIQREAERVIYLYSSVP